MPEEVQTRHNDIPYSLLWQALGDISFCKVMVDESRSRNVLEGDQSVLCRIYAKWPVF